jgi:hypothetical protein
MDELTDDELTDLLLQFLEDHSGQMFTAGEISRASGLSLTVINFHLHYLQFLGLLNVLTDPTRGIYYMSSSTWPNRHILYTDHGLRL